MTVATTTCILDSYSRKTMADDLCARRFKVALNADSSTKPAPSSTKGVQISTKAILALIAIGLFLLWTNNYTDGQTLDAFNNGVRESIRNG